MIVSLKQPVDSEGLCHCTHQVNMFKARLKLEHALLISGFIGLAFHFVIFSATSYNRYKLPALISSAAALSLAIVVAAIGRFRRSNLIEILDALDGTVGFEMRIFWRNLAKAILMHFQLAVYAEFVDLIRMEVQEGV